MTKFQKHRFLGKFSWLYESGYRDFYINKSNKYRERYHDNFLYSLEDGFFNTNKTFQKYCLEELEYDYFMHIYDDLQTNGSFVVDLYDKNNESIPTKDIRSKLYPEDLEEDDLAEAKGGGDEEEAKISEQQQEVVDNASSPSNATLGIIQDALRSEIKIAIFLECFDNLAEIYSVDSNIFVINLLKSMEGKVPPNKVILYGVERITYLKDSYTIDLEEKKSFFSLGFPNNNEIFCALLRTLILKYPNFIHKNEETLLDIANLAETEQRRLQEILEWFECYHKELEDGGAEYFEKEFISEHNQREKITLDNVILRAGDKERLQIAVEEFLNGESKRKGLILYGPSGTGKTEIARAIAYDYKCKFKPITIADLKKGYIGQSAQAVKELYEELELSEPVILFIDECDSIFSSRSTMNTGSSDSFTNEIINAILPRIDGIDSHKRKIFYIGATNHFERLDNAIKSRFDAIAIDLPNAENREQIFLTKLQEINKTIACPVTEFRDFIDNKLEGFSGRDIKSLVGTIESATTEKEVDLGVLKTAIAQFEQQSLSSIKDLFPNVEVSSEYLEGSVAAILGYADLKTALRKHVDVVTLDLERYQDYKERGLASNGVLLYGPPGNGKTFLVQQFAKAYNLYLIKVLAKDMNNEASISMLFEQVYKLCQITAKKGVLLFFDEIDGLIGNVALHPRARASFLDSFANEKYRNHQKMLLFGATNFRERLDEAAIRKGRFDRHLRVGGITTCKIFEANVKSFLAGYSVEQPINFNEAFEIHLKNKIESEYDNEVSMTDIKSFVRDLKEKMFYSDTKILTQKIVNEVIKEVNLYE